MSRWSWRSPRRTGTRSEEHTSELQSRVDLVCRLLLENKNISNSIGKTLKGKVIAEGLAFVGVFSNKIALDPKAAGQFRVSKGGTVHFEKNVRIARGCTIFVD